MNSTTKSNGLDEQARTATKRKSAAKGSGVRISESLREQADVHARVAQRSVQKQVEYWSQLGRLLESRLDSAEVHALLSERQVIVDVRLAANTIPDVDAVLDELAADRASGALRASVTAAEVVYELADDGQSLRRMDADGTVTLGTLIEGRFVEHSVEGISAAP